MTTLTEEMVIARTKQSNLGSITKFNCWGSQLSDVSILRRMPNVTVLSLSVNNIATLADFQFCKKLQDLYVRKNNIKDLNEVCYLQDLPCLRSLWIDENPCVNNFEGYRLAVLRAIPHLSKLDDKPVDTKEVSEAQIYGKVLVHPEHVLEYYSDPEEEFEENYIDNAKVIPQGRSPSPEKISGDISRSQFSPDNPPYQRSREYVSSNVITYEAEDEIYIVPSKSEEDIPSEKNSASKEEDSTLQSLTPPRPQYNPSIPRSRTTDGELGCCNEKSKQYRSCSTFYGSRRPERRTNVLNAVLCLVKELDYADLEVVEMAVRCRMDEMEG